MKFSQAFTLLSVLAADSLAQEECYLPVDVLFLQDTTGSFEDDLPNVVKQIPDMVNAILAQHPNSFFGVAEFKDKPYFPLGEPTDFCFNLGSKLSPDVSDLEYAYSNLYASGGGDLPEAQYQALISAALQPSVGWRTLGHPRAESDDATVAGARLIIISTDAAVHLVGDIAKYRAQGYDIPALPANSGTITPSDPNYECKNQDYPTPDEVKAAIKGQNIYVAILTPEDPVCDENGQNCVNINPVWQWINQDLLGQPADFYQFIKSDSSDFIDGVLQTIDAVTAVACSTTTTKAPPTTAPATSTSVTTTTKATTTTTKATTTTTKATTTTAKPTTTTEATTTSTVTTPKPTTATTTIEATTTTKTATSTSVTTPPPSTSTTSTTQPTTLSYDTTTSTGYTTATTTSTESVVPTGCPTDSPTECPTEQPTQGCADNCQELVIKVGKKAKHVDIDYEA